MGTHVVATPGHEPPRLEDAAARADDPCDVALAAMPAHALGDLCGKDEAWLQHHVAECGYCRNEMSCYEKVDTVLAACCAVPESACVPPLLTLPKRDIVWFTRVASPLGDLILAATDGGGSDPFWMLGARTLFVQSCVQLMKLGQATNAALAYRLMMADLEEVHELLRNTIAEPLTAPLPKLRESPAFQPDKLFLTWQRDPTTTMTVQWIGTVGETKDTNVYYTDDPNGIQVEVTTRLPQYDSVMAHERSLVEQSMADWEKETRPRKEAMRAKIANANHAAK